MTNKPNGVISVGVTNNLARRVFERRTGAAPGFTKRYGLTQLVDYEAFDDITNAIPREKTIKHDSRAWKVGLILETNRDWRDLYEDLA